MTWLTELAPTILLEASNLIRLDLLGCCNFESSDIHLADGAILFAKLVVLLHTPVSAGHAKRVSFVARNENRRFALHLF